MKFVTANSPLGQEILKYLKSKLELPQGMVSFSLHMSIDDGVRVTSEFYAVENEKEIKVEPEWLVQFKKHQVNIRKILEGGK